MAAAVDTDLAAALEAALGGDVDDPGGPQAVLGRQRAGDQVDVAGEAGAEGLAEHGDALRQDHVVQPVLDVGVVAPDVQLSERVLHHPRGLQDHLVERDVLAAGQDVHQLFGQRVGRGAERRLDGLAGGVQLLSGDHQL